MQRYVVEVTADVLVRADEVSEAETPEQAAARIVEYATGDTKVRSTEIVFEETI